MLVGDADSRIMVQVFVDNVLPSGCQIFGSCSRLIYLSHILLQSSEVSSITVSYQDNILEWDFKLFWVFFSVFVDLFFYYR